MDAPGFYAALADDYDGMTAFESRLVTLRKHASRFVSKYNIKTALDVA